MLLPYLLLLFAPDATAQLYYEAESIYVRDEGAICTGSAQSPMEEAAKKPMPRALTGVEHQRIEKQAADVAAAIEWAKKNSKIVGVVIGAAAVTGGLSLPLLGLKVAMTGGQAYCSSFDRVDDSLALLRAVWGVAYTIIYGLGAFPPISPSYTRESMGPMITMTTLNFLLTNLWEAINMFRVVRGSDNRWRKGSVWTKWLIVLGTFVLSSVIFVCTWFAFPNSRTEEWTALGSFEEWGYAPAMTIVYCVLGLLSAIVNLVTAIAFERNPNGWAQVEAMEDIVHREEIRELLRTRWFASTIAVMLSVNMSMAAFAMDDQRTSTGLIALFLSLLGGGISIFNLLYSVQAHKKVQKQLCGGKNEEAPKEDRRRSNRKGNKKGRH